MKYLLLLSLLAGGCAADNLAPSGDDAGETSDESAARLVLTPRSLDFGVASVGCSTEPRGFVVENVGGASARVRTVALSGGPAFILNAPNLPVDLPPGATLSFSVAFAPQAVGAANAGIVIKSMALPDLTASLIGVGDAAAQASYATDSDGDGWPDLAESYAASSPSLASDTPASRNHLVFVVPYDAPALPPDARARAVARLSRADVVFLMDTTGSMAGVIFFLADAFASIAASLAAEVDDLAFGAAGFGDFPSVGQNSEYDVPFYRTHRVMTARTPAGLDSLLGTLVLRNIISDGVGPWFAGMRGGDDAEQGWEALRQLTTGIGISYPTIPGYANPGQVPAFSAGAVFPSVIPAGEEAGTLAGMGFRPDAQPIIIMAGDNLHHDVARTDTSPQSATRSTALAGVLARQARVIGLMPWSMGTAGYDDLAWMAVQSGARVPPSAWGPLGVRPADCPTTACCLLAPDAYDYSDPPQPAPDPDGLCTLVFQSDRYQYELGNVLRSAVLALARGGSFDVGATLIDDTGDSLDAPGAFVEAVQAGASASGCAQGLAIFDADGDGHAETYTQAPPGAELCFEVRLRQNVSVPAASQTLAYSAHLQLWGDGLASMQRIPVTFLVPSLEAPACD